MFLDKLFEQEITMVVPQNPEEQNTIKMLSVFADFVTYSNARRRAYLATADNIDARNIDIADVIMHACIVGATEKMNPAEDYPTAENIGRHFKDALKANRTLIAIIRHSNGPTLIVTAGKRLTGTVSIHSVLLPAAWTAPTVNDVVEYAKQQPTGSVVHDIEVSEASLYQWTEAA